MAPSIDGLASGLDTTTLISSLMKIEAIPQTLLRQRISGTQSFVSALQTLNSRVAALATTAAAAREPGALSSVTASSSSPALDVTATAGAGVGSIDIVIDRVATGQTTVTEPRSTWDAASITITGSSGTPTVITAASDSLSDIVEAVNTAELGVTATLVPVGGGLSRVQFTSTDTGAAAAFTIDGSTVAMTEVRTAEDAQLRLWAGTAAEQAVTSADNTFRDLLPGLELTARTAGTEPVTVMVADDRAAATRTVGGLIEQVASVLSHISANSRVTTETGASGQTTTGGQFTGDSTVRDIRRRMVDAVMNPIDGRSPAEIGVSITRDGVLEFDEERFAETRAADPGRVAAVFAQIAERVADAATSVSDPRDGDLTRRITGRRDFAAELGRQVENWDVRLDRRRATLERTYAALEVALSNLNAQSSWLSSQLAGLTTGVTKQ